MNRVVQLSLTLLALTVGCQAHHPAEPAPSLPETTEFSSPAHGVRLTYPQAWSPAANDAYVLKLVSPRPGESISLDVPRLPPHPPGFIPLGRVVKGYVDDLKKKHPGVAVSEPESTKVAGANAKRVRSTWKDSEGKANSEDAVLTVHGDRVYIFRANTSGDEAPGVGNALETILVSVKWD